MTVENLQRVLWRLRKKLPNTEHPMPSNAELRRAIMHECGTDPATYRNNRKALLLLHWIRIHNKKRIILTNKDLTGD